MKANVKSDRPKAVDTLVNIAEIVLQHRGEDKPRLTTVARITNRASGLLHYDNLDERLETENAATIQIAKKHGLIS
jgi:hypothetical protein